MNLPSTDSHSVERVQQVLRTHAESILRRWSRLVIEWVGPASSLERPLLRDHMPEIVSRLADVVGRGLEAQPLSDLPQLHALQRLDEGFDLQEVSTEYRLLRRALLEELSAQNVELQPAQALLLHDAIDKAVTTSVDRFVEARNRTLIALDRISQVAIGPDGVVHLDQLLPRLLAVLVETTAVIDSGSILIAEGSFLRVRAAFGAAQEPTLGETVQLGECIAGTAAARGEPLFVRDPDNDPLVCNRTVPRNGTRAIYAVPMVHAGEVIAVAMVASRSAWEFADEDLLLIRAMSNRATSLIVKAQLAAKADAAQRQAQAEHQLLSAVIEEMPAAVFVVEAPTGRVVMGNRRIADVLRRPFSEPDEVARYVLANSEYFEGRPYAAHDWPLARALRGESVHDEPSRVTRGDGTRGAFMISAAPLMDREGRVTHGVVSLTDVTRQRDAVRALAESEERLQLIVRGAHLGTYESIDNEPPVLNDVARSLFGLAPASEPVNLHALLERVHPDDQAAFAASFDVETLRASGGVYEAEYRVRPRDGDERWIASRGRMVFDATRRGSHLVGALIDITERKRAQDFADRLIGIVSHDLRSPLMAIRSSATILLRSDELPAKLRRSASRISASTDRMARMISDLLDFTRGRVGMTIPLQPVHVDALAVVRHAIEETEASHPDAQLELTSAGRLDGQWDPDRLAQVLANLLENAIRYRTPGSVVSVTLEGTRDDALELSVHNQGAPIPSELLERIFDPFQRGTSTRREGLGLGLYIARLIVDAHGGTLSVRSNAASGTTFTVRLPRAHRAA